MSSSRTDEVIIINLDGMFPVPASTTRPMCLLDVLQLTGTVNSGCSTGDETVTAVSTVSDAAGVEVIGTMGL